MLVSIVLLLFAGAVTSRISGPTFVTFGPAAADLPRRCRRVTIAVLTHHRSSSHVRRRPRLPTSTVPLATHRARRAALVARWCGVESRTDIDHQQRHTVYSTTSQLHVARSAECLLGPSQGSSDTRRHRRQPSRRICHDGNMDTV